MCKRLCQLSSGLCEDCQRRYLDDMANDVAFDRLCSADPTLLPQHQWATEAEYREHVEDVAPFTRAFETEEACRA